jgi:fused signal recognition particle receptor
MEELKKVKRVMQKIDATAPHEIMLVVDAGTPPLAVPSNLVMVIPVKPTA